MLYKGMVSRSKYWISGKIRVMSTQKRRKNPYARVLVLCQVPLEIIMRVAANLDLATGRALTDLRQYINSDLVFSDLKLLPFYSEIAAVEVVIPNGHEQKMCLATTRSLYQAEIHLI